MADRQPTNSNESIQPAGFLVVRTPRFALDAFVSWSRELSATSRETDYGAQRKTIAENIELARNSLRGWAEDLRVQEAIFVSSPGLYAALEEWCKNPNPRKARRTEAALARYFARMTTRPTPFGLCAAYGIGSVSDVTQLHTGTEYARSVRIDSEILVTIAERVEADESISPSIIYRPNPTIVSSGNTVRFTRVARNGSEFSFSSCSRKRNHRLDRVVAMAAGGVPRGTLTSALAARADFKNDAAQIVSELIREQVLVSDLGLALTGEDAAAQLSAALHCLPGADQVSEALDTTIGNLARLSTQAEYLPPASYTVALNPLRELGYVKSQNEVQVDLHLGDCEFKLNADVLLEVERCVLLLREICIPRPNPTLQKFSADFESRYGTQEVPLLIAIDEELGVGYGSQEEPEELLSGLDMLLGACQPRPPQHWHLRDHELLRILAEALCRKDSVINLSVRTLSVLRAPVPTRLPVSLSVRATVLAHSASEIDRGKYLVWYQGAYGPSGIQPLTRFAQADHELREQLRAYTARERAATPNAIIADVVHLAGPRLGNVSCRPSMWQMEIPTLGKSGIPDSQQLPLSDLLVSVVEGRVVLYSNKLKCEILPRTSTAVDFTHFGARIADFFRSVERQDALPHLRWDWGPLASAPTLPRVQSGRFILEPACWNLRRADVETLFQQSQVDRFLAVQQLRDRFGLPRYCSFVEEDNVLPIDLDNPVSIDSVVPLWENYEIIRLIENLSVSEGSCVEGPHGSFSHELLIPFCRLSSHGAYSGPSLVEGKRSVWEGSVQRNFPPGSPWSYLKLYTNAGNAEQILQSEFRDLIQWARTTIDRFQWFFIRYNDPEHHLRIRFRVDRDSTHYSECRERFEQYGASLIASGLVSKMQADTYEREIERYGGPIGVDLAEQLFAIDSDTALAILDLRFRGSMPPLWAVTLRSIDRLLDDFRLTSQEKLRLAEMVRDQRMTEFNLASQARSPYAKLVLRSLDSGYRARTKDIHSALQKVPEAAFTRINEAIHTRSLGIHRIVEELNYAERAGNLSHSVRQLIPSFVHMNVNRLLSSRHRAQELVLHSDLRRYYRSELARAQGKAQSV